MKFAIGQGIPYQITRQDILEFLDSVFLALWYQVDGTDMVDMLGNYDPITLSADPGTTYIPATYAGTITFPEHADLVAADAAATDGAVAYDGAGTAIGLSNANLIDADLERIPVKYDDASPHHIRMIGLLDDAVYDTLTDADKDKIARYMDLWIYFWTIDRINDGNLKENRTLGDGGAPLNTAPVVANPISDKNYDEYFGTATIELETNPEGPQLYGAFGDADGDALTYSVTVDDESVATASVTGSVITISEGTLSGTLGGGALAGGDSISTTVNVTATDPSGESVTDRFVVTINGVNDAPAIQYEISDRNYASGFGYALLSFSGAFVDPDGDTITYSVSSSDEGVCTVSIPSTNTLRIDEVGNGTCVVTLTASDGPLSTEMQINVTIS